MNLHVSKFTKIELPSIKAALEAEGGVFSKPQYSIFQVRTQGCIATFYESGKVVVQGKSVENFVSKFLNYSLEIQKNAEKSDILLSLPYPHAGIDESGKGDFFGPLIIAGAFLYEKSANLLNEFGVKDSKKLDDKKILFLADKIKENSVYDIVTISNKKYNELYNSFKNLNKLLAWGHATVLENILKKADCTLAISDKFGDERFILSSLKEKGKSVKLIQETKAERDTSVAAASILARSEFVKNISKLGAKYEMNFPKGASDKVLEAGRKFISKYGFEELQNTSKLHFKTAQVLRS